LVAGQAACGLSFLRLLHGAARMNRAALDRTPLSSVLEEQEDFSLRWDDEVGWEQDIPPRAGEERPLLVAARQRRCSFNMAPSHEGRGEQKRAAPTGTALSHAMGRMKGSALLAPLIVAALLLAAALLATLLVLLVLLVRLAGLAALLTGILVLIGHVILS